MNVKLIFSQNNRLDNTRIMIVENGDIKEMEITYEPLEFTVRGDFIIRKYEEICQPHEPLIQQKQYDNFFKFTSFGDDLILNISDLNEKLVFWSDLDYKNLNGKFTDILYWCDEDYVYYYPEDDMGKSKRVCYKEMEENFTKYLA